jgi:excisionase family DNA binding protein
MRDEKNPGKIYQPNFQPWAFLRCEVNYSKSAGVEHPLPLAPTHTSDTVTVPTVTTSTPSTSTFPAVWNSKQAARYLQVHERTLIRMAKAGEIPGFRIGRCWRFHPELLQRWAVQESSNSSTLTGSPQLGKGD